MTTKAGTSDVLSNDIIARRPGADGYKKGHAEASARLKAGELALLGFGMPPDWMEAIYNREFGKYGISYEPYGHASGEESEGYVAGFSEPMAKAIAHKYGPDTIASIQRRIADQLDAALDTKASKMQCIGYASLGAGGTIKLDLIAVDPRHSGAHLLIDRQHRLYREIRRHVGKLSLGKEACVKPWPLKAKAALEAATTAPASSGPAVQPETLGN